MSILGRWRGRAVTVVSHLIPDWEVVKRVPPVGPMRIALRYNRRFWTGSAFRHDAAQFAFMQRFITPQTQALDLGANVGFVTRFMLGNCGARTCTCLEPMPRNRRLLHANLTLLGPAFAGRFNVLPFALSDTDGECEFQADQITGATGQLDTVHGRAVNWSATWGVAFPLITVTTRSLDSLVQTGEVSPPDFIKVDIEGAEPAFVAGARALLASRRPTLTVETHGLDPARETMLPLIDLGYDLYSLAGHDDIGAHKPAAFTREMIVNARVRDDLPFQFAALPRGTDFGGPLLPFLPKPAPV